MANPLYLISSTTRVAPLAHMASGIPHSHQHPREVKIHRP